MGACCWSKEWLNNHSRFAIDMATHDSRLTRFSSELIDAFLHFSKDGKPLSADELVPLGKRIRGPQWDPAKRHQLLAKIDGDCDGLVGSQDFATFMLGKLATVSDEDFLSALRRLKRPMTDSVTQKMLQVLNNKDILPLIIVHGARNEILAFVHRMLMVEAVNTTMGRIAQEEHDEVLEYILQEPQCLPVVSYLFSKGRHKEATEMLVQQLMALNPDADRDSMLEYCYFDANGLLTGWNLNSCKIAELPESFGDVLCTRNLYLQGNQLESLPLNFGNLSVGGDLNLASNKLRCLPPNFEQIRVGRNLYLWSNPELTGIPTEFPNVKGNVIRP